MTAVLFIWPTYHSASRKCKERVVLAPSSLRQTSRAATCRLFCCILTMLFGFAAGQNARASNGANADGTQPVYETYFNPLAWFGSYTPCTYPSPWDRDFKRRCFISERAHEQHNMCNLDGAVSNTEMDGIVTQLNELFNGKRGRCICESASTTLSPFSSTPANYDEVGRARPYRRNDTRNVHARSSDPWARVRQERSISSSASTGQLCWYKVAFAFLNSLPMPSLPLPQQIQQQELCNNSVTGSLRGTDSRKAQTPAPTDTSRWTPKKAQAYGTKFAQIVRERWRIGQCGEDILLLVVVRRPDALGEAEENKTGPVIFASWGDAVRERTAHLTIEGEASLIYLLNHYNRLMADQDKTKLKYYLSGLLDEYFKALSLADQTNMKPPKIRNFAHEDPARLRSKQHIPDWALGAFGGCALLLLVMGLGYCLVKSRVRRGASRAKPGADGGRRWKAGFVGEDTTTQVHMIIQGARLC